MIAALLGVIITVSVVALILGNTRSTGTSASNEKQAAARMSTSASAASNTPASPTTGAPTTGVAASTSAPSGVAASTPAPATSAPKRKAVPSVGTNAQSTPRKGITYTVKRGDNLTVIAAWFHQHGYGHLYELNKSVIGDNPNLIFPGQRITVSSKGMTVNS